MSIKTRHFFLLFLAFFFIAGLFFLKDSTLYTDGPKNYREGKANLDFILTGELDQSVTRYQMHGAFFFMLGEISKRILHDKLGFYDPVSARSFPLLLLVIFFFYLFFCFLEKNLDSYIALISTLSLITFPYFFHHLFFNLKDIPVALFMSLTIIYFFHWRKNLKLQNFYLFFIFFGLACATKLYAFATLLILGSWVLFTLNKKSFQKIKSLLTPRFSLHLLFGFSLFALLFIFLYAPWLPFSENYGKTFEIWRNLFALPQKLSHSEQWVSFKQYFYRAPLLFLVFSILGCFIAMTRFFKDKLNALLIVWTFIPLILPCFKGVVYYDGMRHFLIFLIPAAVLVTQGIKIALIPLKRNQKLYKIGFVLAPIFLIGLNTAGIAATYPYPSIYFNAIIGGLEGAQSKKIYCAHDYWLTSSKEITQWLDKQALPNSHIYLLSSTNTTSKIFLIKHLLTRKDLKLHSEGHKKIQLAIQKNILPPNSYIIFIPSFRTKESSLLFLEKDGLFSDFEKVHELKKQGGIIYQIFYNKDV